MTTMIRNISLAMAMQLTSTLSSAQTPSERFDIDHFSIKGNTLLQASELEKVLQPYTGKQREIGDVQRATEALRLYYRNAGYSVTWVVAPEQDLDTGVVILQVIEAHIGSITIAGNHFFDDTNIRASLPTLSENIVPRAGDISANTQLANENPAKQVDVVLRPGAQPGMVDATIDVIEVQPLKAFVTFDNTGNPQTGDFRLGVGLQHANLFNRDHIATLSYVTSPGNLDQVSIYSGSYRLPLYSLGDSIDVVIARSDVNAGTAETVAGPLTFSGKGDVLGLRYNQLLVRRGIYSHRLVYGLDYRAYENNCTLGAFGADGCGPASVDVTTRPVSVAYSGNWTLPGRISEFYIALSRNIPGAIDGKAADFSAAVPGINNEPGASSRYSIARFGASVVNAFSNNWQVRAAFDAQYTRDALVTGEQFSIAGATAVRGFLERSIARDGGYYANLELYTPNLAGRLVAGTGNLRGLVFYDMARAVNTRLRGELRQQETIASIGAGIRWNIQRNFNLRFDLARLVNEGGDREVGDMRGNFSIYYGF